MKTMDLTIELLEKKISTRARLIEIKEQGVACMEDVEAEAHLNGKLEGLQYALDLLKESNKGVA